MSEASSSSRYVADLQYACYSEKNCNEFVWCIPKSCHLQPPKLSAAAFSLALLVFFTILLWSLVLLSGVEEQAGEER